MTDDPVPLMEEFLEVAPGSLRKTGQVKDLGRKVHRDVFPGRVASRGTVQVTSALGAKPLQGLHALVQRDEQGVPCEEVPPRPGISPSFHRKTSPKGWTLKDVSCIEEDVERGETPEAA